jgi:hypothetical protein
MRSSTNWSSLVCQYRLSIRPPFLYQTQTAATEMIAGSEFLYIVGESDIRSDATGVFIGGWYRLGDAALFTAGLEFKGCSPWFWIRLQYV